MGRRQTRYEKSRVLLSKDDLTDCHSFDVVRRRVWILNGETTYGVSSPSAVQ